MTHETPEEIIEIDENGVVHAVGKTPAQLLPCDVCGRDMRDPADPRSDIGAYIGVELEMTNAPGYKRVYPELPVHFTVCYACWLKSMGWSPTGGDLDGQ